MYRVLCAALVIAAVTTSGGAQERGYKVDKTIDLTRSDGKLVFIERGKDEVVPITIVVGQSIRWENKDKEPHALVSTLTVAGKPLLAPVSSTQETTKTCFLISICTSAEAANQ
jgi:hypothetical protein